MAKVHAAVEGSIDAPAPVVYGYLADMRQHHPRFLPPAFSDFTVESGGAGAGTVIRFTLAAGGRSREYRMLVEEPEPGHLLTESDTASSLLTVFTVTGDQAGRSSVRIETSWEGATGIGGFFERLFAPRALRRIYHDELSRLGSYAREQSGARPGS